METLYRKHRPRRFADLIGQEHVRITIQNQLSGGSVGHAYLFTGPRGVGKTTSARLLAKAVNCLDLGKDGEPCNVCDACKEMNEGRSLDVIEMDAASHTGVDNVRENIIENVRFGPSLRKKKVFIIDEVHMLSTSAFNALLKTLEEPPAHALFILATTEIHKVPETIISRCQRFDFHRIASGELVKRLEGLAKAEGVKVEREVFEEIARRSEGSQRDAESLLAQIFALGEKKITMETASLVLPLSLSSDLFTFVELLSQDDAPAALQHLSSLMEQGTDVTSFLDDLVRFARQLLLARMGSTQVLADLPEAVREKSQALAESFQAEQLTRLLDLLLEARSSSTRIPQLPLELVVVKYGRRTKPDENGAPASLAGPRSPVHKNLSASRPGAPKSSPLPSDDSSSHIGGVPVPRPVEAELEPVSKEDLKEITINAEVALPEEKNGHVTFKTVQGKWDEVFERVSSAHTSLGFLLKSAKLMSVSEGEVRLGFDFKFHADTMNAVKNREKLESAMERVLGSRLRVLGEYVHADADEVVGDLLEEFGGKAA